ncbi:hypothetical protein KAW80_02435 [Candidatus Babeliales bacterium]|nr:hypothetical protein [Candidatus Babeliales bacterium]
MIKLILFLFLLSSSLFGSLREANGAFRNKDYKKTEDLLKALQVEVPDDAIINYDLGVTQYKQNKFEEAKLNFDRALNSSDPKLKSKTIFNNGNTFYKNTLSMLGKNWKNQKLEDKVLDASMKEVKVSIEKYKEVLMLDPSDKPAQVNKKHAEELLKELEKKQQQQNQQNQDEKKQQEGQDKKDKKEKEEENKQDKDCGCNNKKESEKNESKQNEEKQNGNENKDKNDQQKNENDKDGKQKRDEEKLDQKECEEQKEENKNGGDKSKEKEALEEASQKSGKEQQPSMSEAKMDNRELRAMGALLDNLQADEQKIQKALIKQGVAGKMNNYVPGQKNW